MRSKVLRFSKWNRLYEAIDPQVARYPKSPGREITGVSNWGYAAGDSANDRSGYFPEAAADLEKLRIMLSENGWKEMPDKNNDEYGNTTFPEWKERKQCSYMLVYGIRMMIGQLAERMRYQFDYVTMENLCPVRANHFISIEQDLITGIS